MSKQENAHRFFKNEPRTALRRTSSIIAGALVVTGIMLAGCATAGERGDYPHKPPHQGDIPTFGGGTSKELSFSNKRLSVVVAIDEDGKIQEFRAPGTKAFTARNIGKNPIHAGSIAAFEPISIIKTTNPKLCWARGDGNVSCVEWPG